MLVDENAARQDADRSLKDAHVLVQDQVRNIRALEQGLDGRYQNGIVRAQNFLHGKLLRGIDPRALADAFSPPERNEAGTDRTNRQAD
jgi:hypothetical protein